MLDDFAVKSYNFQTKKLQLVTENQYNTGLADLNHRDLNQLIFL